MLTPSLSVSFFLFRFILSFSLLFYFSIFFLAVGEGGCLALLAMPMFLTCSFFSHSFSALFLPQLFTISTSLSFSSLPCIQSESKSVMSKISLNILFLFHFISEAYKPDNKCFVFYCEKCCLRNKHTHQTLQNIKIA